MIIGICGFIGPGKDTIADYLVNLQIAKLGLRTQLYETFT
jgi:dephospho-CoA kinase